ncbi:hypothetical protein Pelo_5866 [Pelomyxa schiedti]|nr:hypothetical protein Pelo_5866 [Pelomyxa schiedti]
MGRLTHSAKLNLVDTQLIDGFTSIYRVARNLPLQDPVMVERAIIGEGHLLDILRGNFGKLSVTRSSTFEPVQMSSSDLIRRLAVLRNETRAASDSILIKSWPQLNKVCHLQMSRDTFRNNVDRGFISWRIILYSCCKRAAIFSKPLIVFSKQKKAAFKDLKYSRASLSCGIFSDTGCLSSTNSRKQGINKMSSLWL